MPILRTCYNGGSILADTFWRTFLRGSTMALTIAEITPLQALKRFNELLALNDADLAVAFAVSPRTLARWRRGNAYPQHEARGKMNQLLTLADTLEDTFDAQSAMHTWMHTESRYLGGLTPAEAIRAGRVDRAQLALTAMEAGVYL